LNRNGSRDVWRNPSFQRLRQLIEFLKIRGVRNRKVQSILITAQRNELKPDH
jgi:hypothetical protein